MTITGNFERFQYFNFETHFPENENRIKKAQTSIEKELVKICFKIMPTISEICSSIYGLNIKRVVR